jgi:hypothetical protein
MIVNVIEPDHGGMLVQSAYFTERLKKNPNKQAPERDCP